MALGISDLANLFGAVKFYKACRGKGIKPIIGADVWMEPLPDSGDKSSTRLLLLVQNTRGYLNLCELIARAWTRNVQRAHGLDHLGLVGRAERRPDRAVGCRVRRRGHGPVGRRHTARAGCGPSHGRAVPEPLLH